MKKLPNILPNIFTDIFAFLAQLRAEKSESVWMPHMIRDISAI
jgi:hypothetical protein